MRRSLGLSVAVLLCAGSLAAASIDESAAPAPAPRPRPRAARVLAERVPATTAPIAAATTVAGTAPSAARGLSKFDDCASLLARIRSSVGAHVTAYGVSGAMTGVAMSARAAAGAAPAGGSAASSPGASVAFSTTNVQEAGADEPDIVKNTATVGFTLFERRLRSLRVSPGPVALLDELSLDIGDRAEMLLIGDRLVVLSQAATTDGRPVTRVRVVDGRDPGALRLVNEGDVDGSYVSARRIGSTVRLVVTRPGPTLPFVFPQSADDGATAEALRLNRALVERSQITDWLPGATTAGRAVSPAVPCAETYLPQTFSGPGATAVLTLSPRDGRILHSTAVVATSSEVYATSGRLYLATGAWTPAGAVTTEIHRFDVSDPGKSVYEASGSVPGRLLRAPWFVAGSVLGQWALSEHNGDLRVATTRDLADDNGITVLRRLHDRLVPVGAVAGLGRGEQLYAVRFMGERAYAVTYRKVDPLYIVDLSNPAAPRVLGELKVPGYSAYLHPVGKSLLLGIGQDDPNEDGLADGTQVSLFDVADASRPKRVAQLKLGDRGTVAGVEADHRAFTWWPNPARAIVTLSNFSDPGAFHGAVGIDVGARSLREVGRVEHAGTEGRCAAPVTRSRVVGASVLTFSATNVNVHSLDDLSPRSSLGYGTARERPICSQNPPPPPRPTPTTTTSTTAALGGFGGD